MSGGENILRLQQPGHFFRTGARVELSEFEEKRISILRLLEIADVSQCLEILFGLFMITLLRCDQVIARKLQRNRNGSECALRCVMNFLRARVVMIAKGSEEVRQHLFI